MCATQTKPARYARWLSNAPEWLLANGRRAGLSLTAPDRRGRPVTQCYWVERVEGGYRMHKEGTVTVYDIDTSFGPEAEAWDCACGAYVWRNRKDGPCRHIRALYNALKKIGM